MRPIRLLIAVALLGAALAVTACGGGDKTSDKPAKGDIEDQLGFDQSGILARQSKVENAIRACMKQQGFDYVPVAPVAQRSALFGSARLSDQDFARQFGYGISTLWGKTSATIDPNQRMRTTLSV